MALLTDHIKSEIVLRLAAFRRSADIAREIEAEFGVALSRFQIRTYDPTKPAFAAGEKWRVLFDKARHAHLHDVAAVPIAHKAYRLNQLQRTLDRARQTGNLVLANATLKQAAEEAGGMLTNSRELAVADTGIAAMSSEERRAVLTESLRKALVITTR